MKGSRVLFQDCVYENNGNGNPGSIAFMRGMSGATVSYGSLKIVRGIVQSTNGRVIISIGSSTDDKNMGYNAVELVDTILKSLATVRFEFANATFLSYGSSKISF